ncbi:MAG TPA: aldo/keto reductase, partial [Eudoraea sp.]|nr:aldo/keto reductase [Eudoraea sp.]
IVAQLNAIAGERGQSLAQMALSWAKRDPRVTSVLLGVSRPEQLEDSLAALDNPGFREEELSRITQILAG